ncbi:hypothetical protein ACFVZR_00570 [Streptomyces sp. NPDC058316]
MRVSAWTAVPRVIAKGGQVHMANHADGGDPRGLDQVIAESSVLRAWQLP